jgi:hypothetical protein
MDAVLSLQADEEVAIEVTYGDFGEADFKINMGPLELGLNYEQTRQLYDALKEWFTPVGLADTEPGK